jgi:hypothetical protein
MVKASQIKVGRIYMTKVGDRVVPVQVIRTGKTYRGRASLTTYWCRSLLTGRDVRVNSVQRFRRKASETDCAMADAEREAGR